MEETLVWIAFLDKNSSWQFVLCFFFMLVALFACYANISFMCPLFRHRNEHLRIPSVRFIFHISLADLLFGVFTAVFLVVHIVSVDGLSSNIQYFLFYLFPYLTFVVEFLIILVSLEQFTEVCSEDYDRDIRIRDCKKQPLVVWLVPVLIIVGVLLTPYDPYESSLVFPLVMSLVFLLTFVITFIYIFVIRRMNLDLHHQELTEQSRLLLLQRNRLILVHLAMTIVFLGLTSVSVLFQLFYTTSSSSSESKPWCLAAGSLALINSVIKPIIYVMGTSFYRDVYVRKDCVATATADGFEESA